VKKIAAIILLGLLLFNWVGYQLYTAVLQSRADETLIASIDRDNYSDADLISIKVPSLHLSSYVNSKEFQRVDGKIEIAGIQYNYVKRRYYQGTLELLCIPNTAATRLQTANNEFFKLVNDLQHPGQSKKTDQHTNSFKGFSAEYFSSANQYSLAGQSRLIGKPADHYLFQIPVVYLSGATQPPDQA
jgi:hypothetical protein